MNRYESSYYYGYLNEIEFMNSLIQKIDDDEIFDNQVQFSIIAPDTTLKFKITLENINEKGNDDGNEEENANTVMIE